MIAIVKLAMKIWLFLQMQITINVLQFVMILHHKLMLRQMNVIVKMDGQT
jgi:hypothetical protein